MEDWLQKQREKYGLGPVGVGFSFLSFFFVLITLVTIVSDMGFSNEVTKYRWFIGIGGATIAALVASVSWAFSIRQAYNLMVKTNASCQEETIRLSNENCSLKTLLQQQTKMVELLEHTKQENEQKIQEQQLGIINLEKEKESLFRLMKKHQAQAEENVFIKLNRLATISVQQQKWLEVTPQVVNFRVEPKPSIAMTMEQEIVERLTVNISLGKQHNIVDGVIFRVQDPVDKKPYGIIVVTGVHLNGSTCEIIKIEHDAFWSEALTSIREDRPKIINAPKNELVPHITIEIEPKLAEDLLRILEGVRTSDFD